jgi:uncharacterized protein
LEYEWDEAKRLKNISKHEIDFRLAVFVFTGPVVIERDLRNEYGEERLIATGYVDDDCLVVVYTKRGNAIRLISAWKGGRNDRRKHQALYPS